MKQKYVVTSAQYNARPHLPFLRSLRHYAEAMEAEILIIPMQGRHHLDDSLHPEIQQHPIINGRIKLNDSIQAERYHVRPQQIDPVTGLARFSQSDISTIFESSKQRMKVVPNSVNSLPKVLMTTGAVTHPNYNTNNRIGRIASKDHVYGAIVVEVENDETYHYRQLRGNSRGQFTDLGVKYFPDGSIKPVSAEAFVAGDWHTGSTDLEVRIATFQMFDFFSPKRLFLHDFFDGHSISHHEENRSVNQAVRHREGRMSLEDELEACAKELMTIHEANGERDIYVVKSNHDEHLERFIQEGRYLKHTQNLYVGTKLAARMVDGEDPLRAGIEMYAQLPDNIRFLTRDEDLKVWSWLLSVHGDKGSNGGRGSPRNLENSYGRSISGHSHTPEIFRNTVKVGTSTGNLDYNKGFASSWMNTHAVVYEGGSFQLINVINGRWKG